MLDERVLNDSQEYIAPYLSDKRRTRADLGHN